MNSPLLPTILTLLAHQNIILTPQKGGQELVGKCLFHKGSKENFSLNPGKGLWQCFAGCGGGTLLELFTRLSGESTEGQAECTPTTTIKVNRTDPHLNYLYNRGFSPEMLTRWNIDWDADIKAIAIPVHNLQNEYMGSIYRNLDPQTKFKYLYPKGFSKSRLLFGANNLASLRTHNLASLHNNGSNTNVLRKSRENINPFCNLASVLDCVLVEGPLDTVWAQEAGIPGLGLLGNSLSEGQIDILIRLGVRQVALCLDNDEAGYQGTAAAIPKLKQAGFWVYVVKLPKGIKDIQELPLATVWGEVNKARLALEGPSHPRWRRWWSGESEAVATAHK